MSTTNDHPRRAPGLLILKVVAVALIGLIERREMVYIHSWQEYQDAAEALYETSPNKTRYCVKWRAAEGKLVLKITDDTRCIKFKTYSSVFLNRFEALNLSLMQKMSNKRPAKPTPALVPIPAVESAPAPAGAVGTAGAASTDMQVDQARASTPAPHGTVAPAAAATAASGGVKKKKGKKRK